ncbi:ATP-binding cassette, subfamily B, MsbA [Dyella jiangningensis]|uniref:lipid A export permease/ATP-binding protein MsbA n=1 Tax=Dyella sp. AtDHG13 TaxID=1938897 RepID=UPI0008911E95|nr:lipid A export permease/ATP-binding protein MsbA [Dyella sp. AtDHG13]PXV55968.1 lipid A export permease/ATP-binding protein MsbA [Dyella sp. AtDHG13]SDK48539.1 ATP-binding cassette, subfamily B, MsbA [Dyella jiangningensis]
MSTPRLSPWSTYRRLLGYTAGHWRTFALAAVGMAADAGCTTLFAKLIKPMLDRLFIYKDPSTIFWMPWWIIGIFGLRGLASYVGDYGMARVGRGVVQAMREDVFDAYLRMPIIDFSRQSSGTHVARITYTCEQVAQASTDAVKTLLVDGFTVIGLVGVMLYYSPVLTLALLVMVPAVAYIAARVGRSYRKVGRRVQDAMGAVTGSLGDMVGSNRDLRIYGGQSSERRRFKDITRHTRKLNLKAASTSALSSALIQFVAALALALIIVIATRPAVLTRMSPGTFFAVLMAMGGILPSLKRLTSVQASIQRGMVAAEDLFAVIDAPSEADSGTIIADRVEGHLAFRHVRFGYPESRAAVLNDITITCRPGTVTALVGRSGSGKSTLASLVPRVFDPQSGQVLLDGHDLREYTLASLRRQVAWVGQQVSLFDGTVAENIAYGELAGASERAIIDAARAANAWDFICALPLGLHTPLGSGGVQLSGGQRQRVAIARAVLKDAPILILDEATAALDAESETLIRDALRRLMANRTTLVIAHHLSSIQHAQHIVLIDEGRIVEQGTHDQLLERGGQYAAFHRMQNIGSVTRLHG